MAEYAKIFDPRPYTQSRSSLAEMSTSLSELAANVIDHLSTDERDQFRQRVAGYKTYEDLPADLKALIDQWNGV